MVANKPSQGPASKIDLVDRILHAKVIDGASTQDISNMIAPYHLTSEEVSAVGMYVQRIDEYMLTNPGCVAEARGKKREPSQGQINKGLLVMTVGGLLLGGGIGYLVTRHAAKAVAAGIMSSLASGMVEQEFGLVAKYISVNPGTEGYVAAMDVYHTQNHLRRLMTQQTSSN